MNSVPYDKATCVCHYTDANVSSHNLWCNLQVDTLEFVSNHLEDKIFYLKQLAYFHLESSAMYKKTNIFNAFQKLSAAPAAFKFPSSPRRHDMKLFLSEVKLLFFKCSIVSWRARTCVWLLHNHIFWSLRNSSGGSASETRASLHFKTLMLISRLNEYSLPRRGEKSSLSEDGEKGLNAV